MSYRWIILGAGVAVALVAASVIGNLIAGALH